MGVSAIREILKVVSQPGMISLAGGMPAPESFPLEIIGELTQTVIEKYSSNAFQYGLTEGFVPLREALVGYLRQSGIKVDVPDILISSGSQGVLDALGKILISSGDTVAVEAPTYLGALQAFNPYQPNYIQLEMDENGLIPESLEHILKTRFVKFIYLVPTFHNPTGRTIPLERRKKIAQLIQTYHALLIEDDPYSALRFQGESLPPIHTFAPDHVVYIGTFSKIFAPGLRIGFCVAPELIRKWLVLVKQGVDLHTSTFNQALAAEYLSGGYLDKHLPKIIQIYQPKQTAMLQALETHFPDTFHWSKPEGGMFLWAIGPKNFDMEKLYWKTIDRKVAFVPGKFFYAHKDEGLETMRLNFTMADATSIEKAIKILAETIQEEMHGRPDA